MRRIRTLARSAGVWIAVFCVLGVWMLVCGCAEQPDVVHTVDGVRAYPSSEAELEEPFSDAFMATDYIVKLRITGMETLERLIANHGTSPVVVGNCANARRWLRDAYPLPLHRPLCLYAHAEPCAEEGRMAFAVYWLNPNRETIAIQIGAVGPQGVRYTARSYYPTRPYKDCEFLDSMPLRLVLTPWEDLLKMAAHTGGDAYLLLVDQSTRPTALPLPLPVPAGADLAASIEDRRGGPSNWVEVEFLDPPARPAR